MIPLTRSSEYAIRALTHLARQPNGGFCLVREMAEELGIPAPFLGKCLQPLVARGLLESQRGRRGGFRLVRPAEEVLLFQIVDAHERLDRPRPCVLGQNRCDDEHACPMHDFWKRGADAFDARLRTTSLADLVGFCEENPGCEFPAALPIDEPAASAEPEMERPRTNGSVLLGGIVSDAG